LVIADDLDLPVGKLRLKEEGSAGGHNGHKSIIAALRTQEYPRFKIGIGDAARDRTIEHVLSTFDRHERDVINASIDACVRACETLLREGPQSTQNEIAAYNRTLGGRDPE
jgi:PTH1 family peptidyl-tRNA hydrolase